MLSKAYIIPKSLLSYIHHYIHLGKKLLKCAEYIKCIVFKMLMNITYINCDYTKTSLTWSHIVLLVFLCFNLSHINDVFALAQREKEMHINLKL